METCYKDFVCVENAKVLNAYFLLWQLAEFNGSCVSFLATTLKWLIPVQLKIILNGVFDFRF